MPKVGGKHFGYDAKSKAAAKAEAARTGKPMESKDAKKGKAKGGGPPWLNKK